MSLADIETKTKSYAKAHAALADVVRDMDDEIKAINKRYGERIAKRVATTKDARALLVSALEGAPALFVKPRTQTFDGIKVGYQKNKGSIVVDNDAKTIELIRKHLGDRADLLIHSVESPVKAAIDNLSVAELKKIGCTVKEATDVIVITPAKNDLDKVIKALMAEDTVAAQ